MLPLYSIKQILNPPQNNEPTDDFRIKQSWTEYDESSSKTPEQRALKYLCYELEVMNPETGERTHFYKAIKFAKVVRLPADAKQSTSFMQKQEQVLSALWDRGVKFITVIANIIKPNPQGLLFMYGVQGVSQSLEDAKRQAHHDFNGFIYAMQGTFRVLELEVARAEESEWLREKMYNMDYMTVVRGIPKANNSGEDGGNKGMGGRNLNPDSQGTLEELIIGMADFEYVIEILSTPVFMETLQGWQRESQKKMTLWYSQLQGTKSLSMNVSIPMMYGASTGQAQGWSKGYTDSNTVSYAQGENFSTSQGQSLTHSFGQTVGQTSGTTLTNSHSSGVTSTHGMSFGQTFGQSEGFSHNVNTGLSQGMNTSQSQGFGSGTSFGMSSGENVSSSHNLGTNENMGFSQNQNYSLGNTASVGTSSSQSLGQSLAETYGNSQNHAVTNTNSVGQNYGISNGLSMGGTWGNSTNNGDAHAKTYNDGISGSGGGSVGAQGLFSGNLSGGVNVGEGVSNSQNTGHGFSSSSNISSNYGNSVGWNASSSSGVSDSVGTTHSLGATQSATNTIGNSTSQSASQSVSNGFGLSNSMGSSESYGTSQGNSIGQNWGANTSENQSYSTGNSLGLSNSVGDGYNVGLSQSQNYGQSVSMSNSETLSQSLGQSLSNSVSQSATAGYGQTESVSNGNSYTTSNGQSTGSNIGTNGTSNFGTSTSMGFGPSIGYNKSYQWLDQGVKDLLELLEYQNERIKNALRSNGAFYSYVYIACPSLDALSTAQAVAKATWQNNMAMTHPFQVLDLTESEQKHLLYHFAAFSADVTKEDVYGSQQYKFCTVLLPEEFVAYTHLPRISEGGIISTVEDIPKFIVPKTKGEIYMGTVLNAERFTFENGYRTQFDYRVDESVLMHGFFTGASRSGKTVAAMRFIAELAHVKRKKTGKRLRIVVMDPKQDWRALARFVEPERFRFYSMGNPRFHPIKLNPWKVPKGVFPQHWVDGIIDIYCRAYGLLERGKQMIGDIVYELYEKYGVFEAMDHENWEEVVPELSSNVSFNEIYQAMLNKKLSLEGPNSKQGRAGNDTRDAYAKLLDRLGCFARKYSIESQLYGTTEGLGIDELIGDDDVTVLESKGLENTFKNFIFGAVTSGFYKYAKSHDGGFLAEDQYETVLVIEEANEVLIGNDTASGGGNSVSLSGESEFEQIIDQSAGYGLFIIAITQKISDMPSSILANSGLIFAGRLERPDDVTAVVRAVNREERIDDRDLVKWFPRCPIGWFICKTARNFDFKESEPVLVSIAELNNAVLNDSELDDILLQSRVKKHR